MYSHKECFLRLCTAPRSLSAHKYNLPLTTCRTHVAEVACTPLQAERTHLTVENGHKHFRTHSHELFWEHLHDTKCLMAWGDDAIVLAFRGTASMANAKADLQVGHKVLGRLHGAVLAGSDSVLSIRGHCPHWPMPRLACSFLAAYAADALSVCLQAWRAPHPPVRGVWWKMTRPLVHMGFLKSWVAGGLGEKVVQRVKELVDTGCKAGVPVKIYVTG